MNIGFTSGIQSSLHEKNLNVYGHKNICIKIVIYGFLMLCFAGGFGASKTYSQGMYPNNYMVNQPNQNYIANSTAFKQEIARMEINVVRPGKVPLSITQVPRLEKGDVLKVRLLDETVNGLKPDQSNFDWTFLVAFINPGRNNDSEKTVSEEINFRKRGWYKEYSLVVPFDSQPMFFLYPKPQYRAKILKLISKNQDEIRKIGEKTIEIADAYAKIGTFLNELQSVVNWNYYRGLYNGYGMYGGYPYNNGMYGNPLGANQHFFSEQIIESLAKSFNIQLPTCWGGSSQYNSPNNYPNYNYGYNNGMNNDFIGRVQCIARNVRVEDFDVSLSRMMQQGGVFVAAQLAQKYPQLSFWINMAAVALDFILKIANKAPLKIVPTIISTNETAMPNVASSAKISLFAETQPANNGFVTAYPMVFHKWQANADPGLINLPMPVLADTCLHPGQNIIRTTDIVNDWMNDTFTKDFQLLVTSDNGFQKRFPLKKNIGLSGWELNVTKEELNTIPKINMSLQAVIIGKRGFSEIQSPKFDVPLPNSGSWSVEPQTQKSFTAGGKRFLTLETKNGNCRCLETVVYKPSFGGEFVFDTKKLTYSEDGKRVSFEIDATNFPGGSGQLELRQSGSDVVSLPLNLYPSVPNVTNLKIAKGDTQAILIGDRLEQIKAIKLNGKRAIIKPASGANYMSAQNVPPSYQGGIPVSPLMRERTFTFEDSSSWQDSNNISLELELEDQRIFWQPNLFKVSPSRPIIVANEVKEVPGFAVNKVNPLVENRQTKLQSNLVDLPILPLEASDIAVNLQNALTDFDFKIENLRIEARIENTEMNPVQISDVNFEVLDWRSIRLNINLSEQTRKILGGRRLQFRLCDKERGNSDWYSIKQTFVRMPQNLSLKCPPDVAKQCELIGKGVNYIQQISVDDGKTWFPQEPLGLASKSISNVLEIALIPNFSGNKKSVKVKLRDFPQIESLTITDFASLNR